MSFISVYLYTFQSISPLPFINHKYKHTYIRVYKNHQPQYFGFQSFPQKFPRFEPRERQNIVGFYFVKTKLNPRAFFFFVLCFLFAKSMDIQRNTKLCIYLTIVLVCFITQFDVRFVVRETFSYRSFILLVFFFFVLL